MAPTLLNGVHEPTRFVLSMFNASQLTPVVRLVWPGIPVWMHWSSCAGWLYNLLRESGLARALDTLMLTITPGPSPNGAGDYKEVMERIRGNKKNSAQEAMLLLSQVSVAPDLNNHTHLIRSSSLETERRMSTITWWSYLAFHPCTITNCTLKTPQRLQVSQESTAHLL